MDLGRSRCDVGIWIEEGWLDVVLGRRGLLGRHDGGGGLLLISSCWVNFSRPRMEL
jgi:hypothetical protein